MTKAIFIYRGARCVGFDISGHSGYAQAGKDIVCAAVSACAMLTCNTVTEFFGCNADATAEGDKVTLRVKCDCHSCDELLRSFNNELSVLSMQYPDNLSVFKLNVKE